MGQTPSAGRHGTDPGLSILQSDLAEYADLREQRRTLDEKIALRRQRLIELDALGARTEPGPWSVSVCTSEVRRLSATALAEAVGDSEVKRLKSLVTPRTQTTVYVSGPPPEGSWRRTPENGR
jgi:hypothetical protein